ncbi:bifunctional pyr operon transcriptional regulator/uracil phosphoribosyltransferase PyrR [Desulfatiferula olefinivorans]
MNTDNPIVNAADINRMITRIAHEILEKHQGVVDNLALIGIQTRGVYIARRIQSEIRKIEGVNVLIGELDITLYRDDWTRIGHHPVVKPTEISFSVDGLDVILVDDVLFTGRTIRAAMDALMDFGRPARIELAVLASRGHREFPIQPDYSGRFFDTRYQDSINVHLTEHDGTDDIVIVRG